ncbi:hypothetical protein NDI56_08810 [Haloarcula sp. S1CR25-12]|uniref:Uncharacterized protein n=1 Tax=Haloarcula saliterrae TaxID=2950534 RepID=A0ABU2FBB9_9EURY|nr:hypothetical protein [Haloarcula sp. S1CR25-12]MDS0259492.1 hypothetical protein [Haloarcula sp. S1CR25-12]
MAHRGSTVRATGRLDPATVGTVLTRVGLALIAVTVPLVAGAAAGLVTEAGSPAVAVAVTTHAMDGPLFAGFGLRWLFHVATLALLSGCWLLGAGLVLDGLFD